MSDLTGASKRVGTKQKEKILKKVREHHRKSKREAKKDVTWKSKKKVDPGIPNSYPYKEQLLEEIEQKRIAAEQARKDARQAQLDSKNGAAADVQDEEMEDEEILNAKASTSVAASPRLFPGTLTDFYSSLKDRKSDPRIISVIYLLDARDPLSWRVADLEEKLLASKCNLTIVLTKCDLVPLEVVAAWVAHLTATTSASVFPICTPEPARNGIKARAGGGIARLVTHLETLCHTQVGKGKVREEGEVEAIAIVGIENSGRTALSNILAPSLPNIEVFDTPSILAASSKSAHISAEDESEDDDEEDSDEVLKVRDEQAAHRILIRNSGAIYKVKEPLPLIDALQRRILQTSDLIMAHNVPAFVDTNDFLIGVARTQGRLKKGHVPDTVAAARHVLRGWSTGELGYYSKPPSGLEGVETAKSAIEKDSSLRNVVLSRKEWRKLWNGKELRLTTGEEGMLGAVKVAFAKPAEIEEDENEEEEQDEEDEEDEEEEEDEGDEDEDDEDEGDEE
ncbi:hypothetical protein CBS101457_000980 [Exobasidium rhododendri]|nr:hypothetical protein CBS101457_000980 [Exobasidium rhododendri]